MVKILKVNFILFLILALAVFLRIFSLSIVPPELFGDELDVGYQAYSILTTGRDLQGNFLPTYIQSLAESRAPLFLYSAVPFVAIFGLNEWGVRLTAAFWGILGVAAIYFLTQKLFKNTNLSLLSAMLLTLSPWHLHYSRAGFEVTLLIFLLMAATYFFLKGLENPKFLILSAVMFAATPYTYSTAALFMPLFGLSLTFIFWTQIRKLLKDFFTRVSIGVFILILIPFVVNFLAGTATDRFQTISVAVNPEIEKNITSKRQVDQGGGFIFHNKPLRFSYETARNYFWAFSPQFLFSDGDPVGRHHLGQMGQLFWFQLPLLLLAAFVLIRGKSNFDKKSLAVLIIWLILAPIPSSLTFNGANNATRLFLMLPPLTIFSVMGIYFIFQKFKRTSVVLSLITIGFLILFSSNLATYFHRYYVHYPVESWRWWQIGYKEAFNYIRENQDKYDTIIINNTYEPALIRMLFYLEYDPVTFHKNYQGDRVEKEIIRGIDGFQFSDKFYFGTLAGRAKGLGAIAPLLDSKTLYLASARDEIGPQLYGGLASEKKAKVLKTITNYLDEPIFYLVTGEE